jgi:hypothetical protein
LTDKENQSKAGRKRLSRRYDPVVKTLRLLMETGNARVKESEAMRLSEIYLLHDRAVERKEIAALRAESRVEQARLIAAGLSTRESSDELLEATAASGALSDKSQDVKKQMEDYLQRTIRNA